MDPGPWKVLVVDDVEGLRRLVTIVLNQRDAYDVVAEAASGEEAIEQVEKAGPDVVLLDLSMPGIDGFETLAHIHERDPDAHVIVLSGHEKQDMAQRAVEQGALAFIEKGEDPTELVAKLDEVLEDAPRRS